MAFEFVLSDDSNTRVLHHRRAQIFILLTVIIFGAFFGVSRFSFLSRAFSKDELWYRGSITWDMSNIEMQFPSSTSSTRFIPSALSLGIKQQGKLQGLIWEIQSKGSLNMKEIK